MLEAFTSSQQGEKRAREFLICMISLIWWFSFVMGSTNNHFKPTWHLNRTRPQISRHSFIQDERPEEISQSSKVLMRLFFSFRILGGCEAPVRSASAASGWSEKQHPSDTFTMSNRAPDSAELLCIVGRWQSIWNGSEKIDHVVILKTVPKYQ